MTIRSIRDITKEQVLLTGGTFLAGGALDALMHAGPTGLVVSGIASFVVARHSDAIVRFFFPPPEAVSAQVEALVLDEQEVYHPDQSAGAKLRRLLGMSTPEVAQPKQEREEERPPAPAGASSQQGPWIPPRFELSSVLDVVHAFNAKGHVYFGDSEGGAIAIPLTEMYHVIDVSSSGKGKSNRFRLAMMQMVGTCQTYCINPFAANGKAVNDARGIEVWKPIYDRLANKRPLKEGPEIKDLLSSLVTEIARRNAQEEQGDFSWRTRPIFVFIDELPEVFARCPEAIDLLDKIGRGGRQFCIFAWVASQTALTKEIGQSTAAQANYKTRIYGGGDKTSCSRLMKGALASDAERTLQTAGAGLSMMLAEGMDVPAFVRAPLVTNEALFQFFGLPPFRKADWMTRGHSLPEQTAHYPALSFPVPPGGAAPSLSTSVPTSQAGGVSPSGSTSVPTSSKRAASGPVEGANYADRSGSEGAEVAEGEKLTLSERERRIGEMFFVDGASTSAIMKVMFPGATGGDKYQRASAKVADALRKYFAVMQKGGLDGRL